MIDWTTVAVLGVQAVIGLFSHISLHKKLNTAAQARLQIGQELATRIATPELAKEDLNAIAQKGAADALNRVITDRGLENIKLAVEPTKIDGGETK